MKKVGVIGGGIAGLSAAYELRREKINCIVYEESARIGGCIKTVREQGYLVECGPNSMLETHSKVRSLINGIGLRTKRQFVRSTAKNRFVVRGGNLAALPHSPLTLIGSRAFSTRAKLRLLREPFIASKSSEQENLADFTLRRFGREFLDYAVEPFVSGIFAGDPAALSIAHAFPGLYKLERKYGSLVRGAMQRARMRKRQNTPQARMYTFAGGMEVLPGTLAKKLGGSIRLRTAVRSIEPRLHGWRINGEPFSDVVIAVPAHAQPELKAPFDLRPLGEIEYPPVASISLGFKVEQFPRAPEGFGLLIPRKERRFSLGVLFPSSIFLGRAPAGRLLLTVFAGGAQSPERAQKNEAQIFSHVLEDLRSLLGLDGEPEFKCMIRWNRAIPQYTIGYEKHLDYMKQIEHEHKGIYFAGNYRNGISVENAMLSGIRAAERIIL